MELRLQEPMHGDAGLCCECGRACEFLQHYEWWAHLERPFDGHSADVKPSLAECNYPGDIRDSIGNVVGPDLSGREVLQFNRIRYDEDAKRSRAGFRYDLVSW